MSGELTAPFAGETQYLVSSYAEEPLRLMIEPEGMSYDLPPHERLLPTVKARRQVQHIELVHSRDGLTLWRPGDSEVWVTTADGQHEQIAGFANNPAPWLDSASAVRSAAPWAWPPPPGGSVQRRWFRRLFR